MALSLMIMMIEVMMILIMIKVVALVVGGGYIFKSVLCLGLKKLSSSFGYSYWRMGDEMMLALGQVEKIPCCRSQSSARESGQQYL